LASKKLAFRLAATAAALAFFPLLELGLRWGGFEYPPSDPPLSIWNPVEDRAMRFGGSMFTTAPRQLWVPRPGAELAWGEDEEINAAGYRGPLRAPEHASGVLRIVVLGESCAFGYGVGYEETFSSRLEEILRRDGRNAEVLDLGVIGHTVRQGLERYRAMARAYRPDVVIETYGEVNEHIEAGGPRDAEKIEGPLPEGSAWGEFVRLARLHVRVVHLLARISDGLHGEKDLERDLRFRESVLEHQIRERMGEIDWEGQRRVPLDDFDATMRTLAREVSSDGGVLLMLSLPRRKETEGKAPVLELYARVLEDVARTEHLPLVDGRAIFREAFGGGAMEEELLRDLWHPTAEGHRMLAQSLAARIEEIVPAGERRGSR
jgi:lysophospholipase L1-like esterase